METINIKGKEYATVNVRLKEFRKYYPDWSIETIILDQDDTQITMKAIVRNENDRIIATGHANEEKSSSTINKTSYVENCETSSIGRALAVLGLGIDGSIASADEVIMAIAKQNGIDAKKTEKVVDLVKPETLKELSLLGIKIEDVATYLKKDADNLTNTDVMNIVNRTKAKRGINA